MVKLAAKMIGLLTTILILVVWIVLNSHLPYSPGLGVNVIVIIAGVLIGLFNYVVVSRQ